MKFLLFLIVPAAAVMLLAGWSFEKYQFGAGLLPTSINQLTESPFLQETMVFPAAELQVETPLVSHPTNKNIFAATAITGVYPGGYTTGFYRTTNGGSTWSGTNAIKNMSGEIIPTGGDPQIVATADGKFVICYLAGMPFKVGVSYSTNNGANWTPTYMVPGIDTADKCVMAMDDYPQSPYYGRCYIAYSERGGTYISYSTNSGETWSGAKRICPTNRYNRVGACIATGPSGEVYVSWPYNQSSVEYIGFARSTNGGIKWDSTDFAITTKSTSPGFRVTLNLVKLNGLPVISVDKSGGQRHGTVYASFIERKTTGSPSLDTCDIVLMSSTDKGSTWGNKVRVNESIAGSKSYQLFHQLNIDKSGNINVFYVDTRDTPSNDSFMVYMSRSTNYGTTFTDTKASNHKFKLKQLPSSQRLFGVPSYIGSYIGLASSSDRVIGFWFDNVDEQYRAYSVIYPLSTNLTVKAIPQGLYDDSSNRLKKKDTLSLYICAATSPYQKIDSAVGVLDSLSFTMNASFSNLPSGNYYIRIKHKKCLTVWSSAPVGVITGNANSFDFTLSPGSAYGSNQIQVDSSPEKYALYAGEINCDDVIDVTDASAIENDAFNYVLGNTITDINEDGFVDATDIAFADYGSANFLMMQSP
jgi:hypothetical protein